MPRRSRGSACDGPDTAPDGLAWWRLRSIWRSKKRAAEPGETGDLKLLLLYVIVTVVMVRFHGELVGGFNPSEKY